MTTRSIVDETYTHRLARWLSQILHPCNISALTLLLAIYLDVGSLWQAILWTAICVAAFLLPLSIFILAMVRIGRYSDVDVSVREQRHGLYLAACAGLLLLVAAFTLGGAPPIGRACTYAAVFGVAASAVLNRFSKISLHAMTAAGCAIVFFHLAPVISLPLTIAAALVGWSRVHLKRHTWPQVIAGWGTAIMCVAAVFYFYL